MGVVRPVTLSEFVGACFFTGLVMAFCQIMFISALNLSKNAGKLTILMLLYTVSGYLISFFKFDEEINFICVMGLVMMGFGLYRTIFLATS
jgi:NAD/NADP transhydrogenase beta subunit